MYFHKQRHSCEMPYINAALGEATREAARHDTRSRRKQLVRVNELASERAGESEPATMTMYYVLYVGVREQKKKKRKQTEYRRIPFCKNHINDSKIKLFFFSHLTLPFLHIFIE